jgi:hypothetical protein
MNSDHPVGILPVTTSNAYRFIRFRQTGKNHGGQHDYLILRAFEIFGELIDG